VRHHLAETSRDVQPCRMVPPDVKNAMQFLIWLEHRYGTSRDEEVIGRDDKLILTPVVMI